MSTQTDDQAARAIVSQAGEGEAIWFLNSRMTVKVPGELTNGAFAVTEAVVPPGFSPPRHIHHREEESFYVIEGRLTIQCGDDTYSADAGSFVCLPRDVPHTFRVDSDTPVR